MIAVADSGPLMALAKVGGLDVLFQLFPRIVATPAVFSETVIMGQRLGASDARLLTACFEEGRIMVQAPPADRLPELSKLGSGEEESVRLALALRAEWLLVDDLDARRAAEEILSAAGAVTRVKGTLGVIVSACQQGALPLEDALQLLRALGDRPDIWLNQKLIFRAIDSLSGS
ncbi:MAG TPA: hypothetical protein VH394_11145 [Thermoanaerobaculia bacterium]|nr:hypothetical protein [Thermoanaerobaculia bacterium]